MLLNRVEQMFNFTCMVFDLINNLFSPSHTHIQLLPSLYLNMSPLQVASAMSYESDQQNHQNRVSSNQSHKGE